MGTCDESPQPFSYSRILVEGLHSARVRSFVIECEESKHVDTDHTFAADSSVQGLPSTGE
jgi:hypothetical protein